MTVMARKPERNHGAYLESGFFTSPNDTDQPLNQQQQYGLSNIKQGNIWYLLRRNSKEK